MTIDEVTLMAYADGELDPLTAKRVERAIAADPALGEVVAAHRSLRARMSEAFAPIAQMPVPDRLAATIASAPVPLPARAAPARKRWMEVAAIAATLLIGVLAGQQWRSGPVAVTHGKMIASGGLARSLDTQLAANPGDTRILASFRSGGGQYCRVFAAAAVDGIACHEEGDWVLRQTRAASPVPGTDYRQAGSADASLLAEAQNMMAGDPLDAAAERKAREKGWR